MVRFRLVRILLDYRPALRARTGVGEFIHELARALAAGPSPSPRELCLFTSSWKDRPSAEVTAEIPGARIVDRRIPVRPLSWMWNNLGWPPVETLAGAVDVAHAAGPLLLPSRRAAQVVTIHDLDFLHHPERATAEMRRDFPRHVREHARRADHVIAVSWYVRGQVTQALEVDAERVSVCSPGAPAWAGEVAAARTRKGAGSTILFLGTLEPRKNVGGLLAAYRALVSTQRAVPRLVLAGRVSDTAEKALAGLDRRTREHVDVLGYVSAADKRRLYADARMLVLPSFEEGFGLPVLEAMACGVPVVISNRGSLPEVAGDAADPVDPLDTAGLTARMTALLDEDVAAGASWRGLARAEQYSWRTCAAAVEHAYAAAIAHRQHR